MKENNLAPIVLFVYKRPDHTKKVLDSLVQNKEAKYTTLYVFADGAKNENDAIEKYNIATVKEIVNSFRNNFQSFELIEREHNLGLADNIIDGISTVIDKHQKVIVLEDDIVVSKGFLKYMNEALLVYENSPNVATIQGFQFPIKFNKKVNTYFDFAVGCWGWATWKNRWELFEPNAEKLWNEINNNFSWKKFDLENSYYFKEMLEDKIALKNNSWAIRWYASLFINNKINLYPTKSLTTNIGNDGSGNHKDKNNISNYPIANQIELTKVDTKLSYTAIRKVILYRKKQLFIKKMQNQFIKFKINILHKILNGKSNNKL
ncbi:MAG: glycosyltransferase family 2 protein [Bacteroidia bacterium]